MTTPTDTELLDKVKEAMSTLLDGGVVKSYSINGRQLEHFSLKELMDLRTQLQVNISANDSRPRTGHVTFEDAQ